MKKIICLSIMVLFIAGCSSKKAGELTPIFQKTNTEENITSISFADKNHGWAVTDAGSLLSTSDAGVTWELTKITDRKLTAVVAIDKKTYWVAGENGALFQSMEGSSSMKDRSIEEDVDFVDIAFWDEDNGVLIGNRFDRDSNIVGAVFRTEDGGQKWGEVYVDMDKVNSLFTLGEVQGWAGTRGHIWTTTDNGANWEDNYLGSEISINSMFYDYYSSGWLVGDSGTYYTSTDGGWSWTDRGEQFPKQDLYHIEFIDRFGGFIVGQNGLIMITQDGGNAWSLNTSTASVNLYDVAADGSNVWICGAKGTIIYYH
jgi:photosystem II stability/assembly factor-like uncharacterized protein